MRFLHDWQTQKPDRCTQQKGSPKENLAEQPTPPFGRGRNFEVLRVSSLCHCALLCAKKSGLGFDRFFCRVFADCSITISLHALFQAIASADHFIILILAIKSHLSLQEQVEVRGVALLAENEKNRWNAILKSAIFQTLKIGVSIHPR